MFENPRRARQASKKLHNKRSENSRSQIVFRTDIFRKLSLGAPITNWAMKTHGIEIRPICYFTLARELNDAMNMMWTAEIQVLNEDMIVAVVIAI